MPGPVELEELAQHWNTFGERDPLWSIKTDPGMRGGRWDLEAFFATGQTDVDEVFKRIGAERVSVLPGRALDFGCGVGRLSRALAERFQRVDGVDLAASMIEQARELGAVTPNCHFHHNQRPDLSQFPDASFDFVLSLIVLQHMEPGLMRSYLREFMRVLRPGGIAFFNIPAGQIPGSPLPDDAWRASIELADDPPPARAAQALSLLVRVTNDSPRPWPSTALLHLGNHWRTPDGEMLVQDDAREPLGAELAPGETRELQLDVAVPSEPGDYELELDLVQEGVAWAANRGSDTLRAPVRAAPAEGNGDGAAAPAPVMEMHFLPRADVIHTLERAGGVVLDAAVFDRCGVAIESVDYVVARSWAPAEAGSPDSDGPLDTVMARSAEPPLPELPDPEHLRHARALLRERSELTSFPLADPADGAAALKALPRRVLRRVLLQVFHRQSEFNRASMALIDALEADLVRHRELLAHSEERVHRLEAGAREATRRHRELERGVRRAELRAALADRGPELPPDFDYRGFTDAFRGPRELIRGRQQPYVEFFSGLSDVLDIGPGRGEFLELLREAGVPAWGVDADEVMVEHCRGLGLDVRLGDGLQHLRSLAPGSLGGIFAAQVVEHLPRPAVIELVSLAFSRLRPGGVLILETINPMCLATFATFFLDFTHLAPIPPPALQWLAGSVGFGPVDVRFTSPVEPDGKLARLPAAVGEVEEFNRGVDRVNDLLFGHQEYAVVARRPA